MTDAPAGRIRPLPLAVLISGGGSNLQALLDAWRAGALPVEPRVVIANRADAGGLERAQRTGVPTVVLAHRAFADRAAFDQALRARLDEFAPELVVLAGFMRILTPEFVRHYWGRLLNIHPSLLPAFPGLHTHARALAAGAREHGATVHFVTEALDGGPAILQARVPVLPGDDADTLAARVLAREHRIYPQVVRWFADGRLRLGKDGLAWLDGAPLHAPLTLNETGETI